MRMKSTVSSGIHSLSTGLTVDSRKRSGSVPEDNNEGCDEYYSDRDGSIEIDGPTENCVVDSRRL